MTRAIGIRLIGAPILVWLVVSRCLGQVESIQRPSALVEQVPPPPVEEPGLQLRAPGIRKPAIRDAADAPRTAT